MAVTDAPTIAIAGHVISDVWTTTNRIVLAGLAITWGRRRHLDAAKAAQLKVELLDPDGHLATAAELTGQLITVTRADGRIIFRGRVDDFEVEHIYITDPVSNARRRVWRLNMTAACKLAELGQATLPGPGNDPNFTPQFGPDYWITQKPAPRLAALLAQGANRIVDAIAWTDPYGSGGWYPMMRYRKFADRMSALDHIEAAYNTIPLAHVNYVPATNTIQPAQPATSNGLRLSWDGVTLSLDLPGGQTVRAEIVAVPGGYKARTGIDEAIDVVQIITPQYGPATEYEIVDTAVERATARYSPTVTGRRELTIKNDVYYNDGTGPDAWQLLTARDTASMLNELNGKINLPPLRFDWRRFEYPSAIASTFIDTFDKPVPLYFPGSVFNVITDASTTHQVIGGTLVFHNGWTLDATVAPTVGIGAVITVNQLCADDEPTLDDFDPGITIADLGNVTQGVPA